MTIDPWLDREYDTVATVPSLAPYATAFVERSLATRARYAPEIDVAYGDHPRERLDLFPASAAGSPLVLFVHGGYWRRFSKDEFAFTIAPYVARGCAAAVISYPLAPEATLDEIVASVRRAVLWLHANVARTRAGSGRIVAAGHSAGGQLVGMLAAMDWRAHGLEDGAAPLETIVPISGLFDLEPLLRTRVNEWLHADDAIARRNSPIRLAAPGGIGLIAGVGSAESSEFRRQTHAYADHWRASGGAVAKIECAARNHFDVLEELADAGGSLARAIFQRM